MQNRRNRSTGTECSKAARDMTAVDPTPPIRSEHGTGWVVVQFALMGALLSTGPVYRAAWSGGWIRSFAGVLLAIGAWAGILGKRDLGAHRTPFTRPKDDGCLVTTGIHARVRHPLYLGVIAPGFSWALLWRSGPALALAAMQIPFFDLKARREEHWLRERYAGYAGHARRVNRFVPGLY